MKYNDNLEIIPNLVQKYEIKENGLVYNFYLKENLFWQDNNPLTADDVVFTIKTIQDPAFKSPLRPNWIGVEVEKINDLAFRFRLKKKYAPFIENCVLQIIPKHIWEKVPAENFSLSPYNLNPIGAGPYKVKNIRQEKNGYIKSITLERNPLYFGQKPYISEIKFVYFKDEKSLVSAAQRGKIKSFSLSSYQGIDKRWNNYFFSLPRYFALFFNPEQAEPLAEKEIRIAINYGLDKKSLVKNVFNLPSNSPLIEKFILDYPLLPNIYEIEPSSSLLYEYNPQKAEELLEKAGYFDENNDGVREKKIEEEKFLFKSRLQTNSKGKEVRELQKCLAKFPDIYPSGEITGYFGNKTKKAVIKFQEKYKESILEPAGLTKGTGVVGKGTREKLNEICFEPSDKFLALKFKLITVDQPNLIKTAEEIKKQLEKIGVKIEIEKFPVSQLERDFLKPRKYDILLFGEILGAIPDPLPFWHSSQKIDPGLNLAGYENKKADKLLEELRETFDKEEQKEKLSRFQEILPSDAPAVFLYSPDYLYFVSKEIKGINTKIIVDPSKRFTSIENWFIKTKRIWK